MAKQISKAKKYQPNKALSKLIDLGEYEASQKMNKDNLIKNIATKFQEARIRLRSNKPPNGYSTPRTPAPVQSMSALSPTQH